MASPASFMRHPIHPMLIPFPIALWVFSFVADLVYLWRSNVGWEWMAYWTILSGCVGAVAAAVFGIIDYFAIKDKEVAKIAGWHARINVLALVLFAVSWYFRRGVDFANPNGKLTLPIALSAVGIIAVTISGWLGGELVFKHGVAVNPQNDSRVEEAAKARVS
ncbi:MAG TPA: DUF2231 domain-containing protein [Pyrinomonadaceae bacterium]|nr:DUF2231 domain-containing protein [Pyrinomonadaceae bacterium]